MAPPLDITMQRQEGEMCIPFHTLPLLFNILVPFPLEFCTLETLFQIQDYFISK